MVMLETNIWQWLISSKYICNTILDVYVYLILKAEAQNAG